MSVRDRLRAWRNRIRGAGAHAQDDTDLEGSDTGPIDIPIGPSMAQRQADRARCIVESFDEDHENWLDKGKRWAALCVAVVLPLVAILAVSNEVGFYFAGFRPLSMTDATNWPAYAIAYAIESALAGLTYAMAHILQRKKLDRGNAIRLALIGGLWGLFNVGSGLGQYVVTLLNLHASSHEAKTMILVRVVCVVFLDLVSVMIFAAFRGKSLAKHLEDMNKKKVAIKAVNDAEIEIQEAHDEAARKREENRQYLASKHAREAMLLRIEEIQASAMITQAERMLLPDGENRNGRQLRGY
jgi:hypothetical protein